MSSDDQLQGRLAVTRKITDARAMRALAHPVRIALLEALAHVGTLTATQAGELLSETPANCAFHLRTLAKYGFVEEAGGGRGRERPWRRAHAAFSVPVGASDPATAVAAAEFNTVWLDTMLGRARAALADPGSWPEPWAGSGLGWSEHFLYLTPQEARELAGLAHDLFRRHFDRVDHPERRPSGATPVEVLVLAYPLLHLARSAAAGRSGQTAPPGGHGPDHQRGGGGLTCGG